jgi:hypothetical protein
MAPKCKNGEAKKPWEDRWTLLLCLTLLGTKEITRYPEGLGTGGGGSQNKSSVHKRGVLYAGLRPSLPSSPHNLPVKNVIPMLTHGKQVQRGEATCPRLHSEKGAGLYSGCLAPERRLDNKEISTGSWVLGVHRQKREGLKTVGCPGGPGEEAAAPLLVVPFFKAPDVRGGRLGHLGNPGLAGISPATRSPAHGSHREDGQAVHERPG